MYISIDFNSDEALYLQLRNQIVYAIVKAELREGENLPSVRDMAETVGINMHTVNKAYAMLRQEGYLQLDRRHGAIVAEIKARMELAQTMDLILAQAICKNVSREDVHKLVDEIYNQYEGYRNGESL